MRKQTESGFSAQVSSRKLKQALSRLPDHDQEILLMRFMDQLGNDEIQEVLGISESEARLRIRKALQKLQTILEQA